MRNVGYKLNLRQVVYVGRDVTEARLGFEAWMSCLLDRRLNHLSFFLQPLSKGN